MRLTWRVILWDGYLAPVVLLCALVNLTTLPLTFFTDVPAHVPAFIAIPSGVLGLGLWLPMGWLWRKYPRRGDLPEWKEYERSQLDPTGKRH